MTPATAAALEEAAELLDTLHNHLDRYRDAEPLAQHLAKSGVTIAAGDQDDLRALYLIHAAAHSEDIQAARLAVQRLEQALAEEAESDV
jgi:phytoene dehydrogenase-like protein